MNLNANQTDLVRKVKDEVGNTHSFVGKLTDTPIFWPVGGYKHYEKACELLGQAYYELAQLEALWTNPSTRPKEND